jgi:hypothetical protein
LKPAFQAIYVLSITPLIMLSKPVLPKVTWGYDFLPQMACHMHGNPGETQEKCSPLEINT